MKTKSLLIGGGIAAASHADGLVKCAREFSAVVTTREESAALFAKNHGIQRYESDLDPLLAEDIDVVHICTPPSTHGQLIRKCLLSGKHVICEKPLSCDPEEAAELAALAEKSGKICAVTFNVRYHDAIEKARDMIASGELGRIFMIHGSYLQEYHILPGPADWRYREESAGPTRAISEIGSHWMDLVEYVSGQKIAEVSADLKNTSPERILKDGMMYPPDSGVEGELFNVSSEDICLAHFRFENGACGSAVWSEVSPGKGNDLNFEITCENGSISWSSEDCQALRIGKRGEGIRTVRFPFGNGFTDTYRVLFSHIYSLIEKRDADAGNAAFPGFSDGARNAALCGAVKQSADLGSAWVSIDESSDKIRRKRISAEELVDMLGLEPLPLEGGMYLQTYASSERLGDAPAGTAIYYLLSGQNFSHLHRLPRGEMYHFYLGDPVELTELLPDGSIRHTVLGHDVLNGQKVQYMVEPGNWQGSHLAEGGEYALIGTTMCPGYTEDCYEHGDRKKLLSQYPGAEEEIRRLTSDEED